MSSGYAALALAVIVGAYAPAVDKATKHRLGLLMADHGAPGAPIAVAADSVVCRAGDVNIAAFSCVMAFGRRSVNLSGRPAHEVFATLAENGVPGDGAAGTIYEAVHRLNCSLDSAAMARKDGGGASCSFTDGPP